LAGILDRLPKTTSPDLLVGMETMDDAGVFRISPDVALVQTVDFFYPVVNDPYHFGRIVAANALSDIWAMGARALTAMNLLAYPAGKIPPESVEWLLKGGSEKLVEAGVVLVGGHTMEQEEFVYGMSVTGVLHPDRVQTNATARVGDVLILTKPLGTGVYANALEKDGLAYTQYEEFVGSMERLNKSASEVLVRFDVSAMTDVTGFGLLGHAYPIARNAGVALVIRCGDVPLFTDTIELMDAYNTQPVCKCKRYVWPATRVEDGVDAHLPMLFMEAQTSGGLLAAIRAEQAEAAVAALGEAGDARSAIIGEVVPGPDPTDPEPKVLRLVP
jgi:selenide,water dikinase